MESDVSNFKIDVLNKYVFLLNVFYSYNLSTLIYFILFWILSIRGYRVNMAFVFQGNRANQHSSPAPMTEQLYMARLDAI